ncbi:probable G-protein coupled receptor B0563.6 [Haliotis cracherodii]|uniref:probable G-protein coupled receptor B0563.6 n=1 Tax=Haliotis cracherodii TaxID=6455 RepID=UPI0039EC03FB
MDLLYDMEAINWTFLRYNISGFLDNYDYNADDADEYERLFAAGVYINNYYLWVIFGFGFSGNIASTVTLSRMKPMTTSKFYVALLAIIDNMAIFQKLLFHQLTYHEVEIGSIGCRIMNFLYLCLVTYSNWILVFMAIERFMAVTFPLRVSVIWNLNRARLSMIILGVVITAIYSHTFWTTLSHDGIQCGIAEEYDFFYRRIWYWINASLYSFIPSAILIVCNLLITLRVRKSGQRRSRLYSETELERGTHLNRYERQITIMLLTVAVVFLVLTLPRTVFVLVDSSWTPGRLSLNYARKLLLDQLTFFLCDATHAVNFYLYFITGQKFRQSFLGIAFGRSRNSSVAFNHSRVQMTHNGTGESSLNAGSLTCKACVQMKGGNESIMMQSRYK